MAWSCCSSSSSHCWSSVLQCRVKRSLVNYFRRLLPLIRKTGLHNACTVKDQAIWNSSQDMYHTPQGISPNTLVRWLCCGLHGLSSKKCVLSVYCMIFATKQLQSPEIRIERMIMSFACPLYTAKVWLICRLRPQTPRPLGPPEELTRPIATEKSHERLGSCLPVHVEN